MDKTHLSPHAVERLEEELEHRATIRRKEISEWLARAREHGDIRENADYDAAKNEQGQNEARIRHIQALLKEAVVVEAAPADRAEAGTVVEVRMEGDDETSSYLLGSIEERGRGYDVISPGSPLGRALFGHGPGEVVAYDAPGGRFSVEIVSVRSPD